jgi:hypothetical protein
MLSWPHCHTTAWCRGNRTWCYRGALVATSGGWMVWGHGHAAVALALWTLQITVGKHEDPWPRDQAWVWKRICQIVDLSLCQLQVELQPTFSFHCRYVPISAAAVIITLMLLLPVWPCHHRGVPDLTAPFYFVILGGRNPQPFRGHTPQRSVRWYTWYCVCTRHIPHVSNGGVEGILPS